MRGVAPFARRRRRGRRGLAAAGTATFGVQGAVPTSAHGAWRSSPGGVSVAVTRACEWAGTPSRAAPVAAHRRPQACWGLLAHLTEVSQVLRHERSPLPRSMQASDRRSLLAIVRPRPGAGR